MKQISHGTITAEAGGGVHGVHCADPSISVYIFETLIKSSLGH